MMLALSPQIQPYNQQELTANRIQLGNIQNRTSLLDLAELERQLGTQADVRQWYAEDPSRLLGTPGGGTTLGGLGPAPGMGADHARAAAWDARADADHSRLPRCQSLRGGVAARWRPTPGRRRHAHRHAAPERPRQSGASPPSP